MDFIKVSVWADLDKKCLKGIFFAVFGISGEFGGTDPKVMGTNSGDPKVNMKIIRAYTVLLYYHRWQERIRGKTEL